MKETIIVTGGAGFIGSNLVKELNKKGIDKIIIIDSLKKTGKWENLKDLTFYDFINYEIGIEKIIKKIKNVKTKAIFHLGANSDVLDSDSNKMVELNFEHSKEWLSFSLTKKITFVFASSSAIYGNKFLKEKNKNIEDKPHNIYALSKMMFEKHLAIISTKRDLDSPVIGFRFFNTYGPREYHKRENASLVYRFYEFITKYGKIKLFENGDKIKRDYLWVKDNVKILTKILDKKIPNGIYDLGTGLSTSHTELANMVIDILKDYGKISSKKENKDYIELIPFPENLKGKFQFLTKANIPKWLQDFPFTKLRDGIKEYYGEIIDREKK